MNIKRGYVFKLLDWSIPENDCIATTRFVFLDTQSIWSAKGGVFLHNIMPLTNTLQMMQPHTLK